MIIFSHLITFLQQQPLQGYLLKYLGLKSLKFLFFFEGGGNTPESLKSL